MGDWDVDDVPPKGDAAEEAREVLRLLRKCRSRLDKLNLHHAAAYADISVQLLKQSIADRDDHVDEAARGSSDPPGPR